MPAVDPARLAREIDAILEHFGDPGALRRLVLDVLDFYADRARRPGASIHADDAPWAFGVPRPVLRSMGRALRARSVQQPQVALAAAEALWGAGYRETQVLAASILASQAGPQAADWAQPRAEACQDRAALAELAGPGMEGWRRAEPQAFLARASVWLRSANPRLLAFGLLALTAAVEAPGFVDLPAVLRMLAGVCGETRGESRRGLVALVRVLARRSPAETARFVLDELEARTPGAERLLRGVLEAFPAPQRERLAQALSG